MKKHTVACIIFITFLCLSFAYYTPVFSYPNKDNKRASVNFHQRIAHHDNQESTNLYYEAGGEKETIIGVDQTTGTKRLKVYKVWVTLIDPSIKVEGYLYDCNDSSIIVSSVNEQLNEQSSQLISNREFQVSNIKKIKLRRKGSIGKGYLIGTSIGIGTGIILGATDGDGFVIFAAAGMLGIVGSIVGTTVGLISGSKTYNIGGNLDAYRMYKSKLKASSMVKD